MLFKIYSKRIRTKDMIQNLHSTIERHSGFKLPGNRSQAPFTKLDRPSLERKQSRSIETITIVFPRRRDRVTNETRLEPSCHDRRHDTRQGRLPHRAGSSRWSLEVVAFAEAPCAVKEMLVKRLCNIRS